LCDRLVIMDAGRIVDEGSPAELIGRHVTREVVELRLDHDDLDAPVLDAIRRSGTRTENLADRVLVYTDDGDPLVAGLLDDGLRPLSVLVRRSTLEDVFLMLTGRTLVED